MVIPRGLDRRRPAAWPGNGARPGAASGGSDPGPHDDRWAEVRLGVLLLPMTAVWSLMLAEAVRREAWRRLAVAVSVPASPRRGGGER
jgi:hypothetical protein